MKRQPNQRKAYLQTRTIHPIKHRKDTTNSPHLQQISTKITQSSIKLHQTYCISRKKKRTFAAILQQHILCDSYVIPMIFVCYSANNTDTPPYQQNSIRLTQTTYQYGRSKTTDSVRRDSRSN